MVFVVYPQIKLLDLTGPLQTFSDALDSNGVCFYKPVIASVDGKTVLTDTCIALATESLVDWKRRKIDTLVVVGGSGVYEAVKDSQLVDLIVRISSRANRVGSVCSGAFLLATCGLLNGRRATTHWESTEKLAADYPDINVEPDSIFVKDDKFWTSAGVTAGIDMSLAMVGEDLGNSLALSLARSLVTFFVRPGGQSQFSTALQLQTSGNNDRFDSLHSWVLSNLDKDLSIETLANKANVSARHFSRLYLAETGQTPAKAIEMIRVEAARRMLDGGKASIASVARACGFQNDERMRRSFIRILKVPPSHYLNKLESG